MAVHSRALVDVDCSSIFFAFGSNNFFCIGDAFRTSEFRLFWDIYPFFFFHIDNCRYEQIVLLSVKLDKPVNVRIDELQVSTKYLL